MSSLSQIKQHYERQKGQKEYIERSLDRAEKDKIKYQEQYGASLKAQEVIKIVSKNTQKKLEFHLSDLVSYAMKGIFPDPYTLDVEFLSKHKKASVELNFRQGDHIIPVKKSTGGGVRDISSLALRFSSWAIQTPRSRPIIFLDEPLKGLKGTIRSPNGSEISLPARGAEMLHDLSHRLGIQIIMVSHDPELINGADKVINIGIKNKKSRIIRHRE